MANTVRGQIFERLNLFPRKSINIKRLGELQQHKNFEGAKSTFNADFKEMFQSQK